jgi:hypothetical protein
MASARDPDSHQYPLLSLEWSGQAYPLDIPFGGMHRHTGCGSIVGCLFISQEKGILPKNPCDQNNQQVKRLPPDIKPIAERRNNESGDIDKTQCQRFWLVYLVDLGGAYFFSFVCIDEFAVVDNNVIKLHPELAVYTVDGINFPNGAVI